MKTILFLLIVPFFAVCSSGDPVEGVPPLAERKTPSDVVRSYVRIASSGKLEELETITIASPKSNVETSTERKLNANGTVFVVPDNEVATKATLEWIRGDFPESIRTDGFVLKSIIVETVKGEEAQVETAIGKPSAGVTGWVFLLRYRDDKWLIYDIITPAGRPG